MRKTPRILSVIMLFLVLSLALPPRAAVQAAPDVATYLVNQAVATGLAGYWPFDPAVPGSVKDASGNGNHGVIFGGIVASGSAPTLFPNPRGRMFDGTEDYISVPDSASLDLTDEMTLAMWVYLDDTNEQYLLSKKPSAGTSGYALSINHADQIRGEIWDSTGALLSVTGGAVSTAAWFHLAVTFQRNGNMVVYKNGAAMNTVAAGSNAIGVNSSNLVIGAASWSTNSFEVDGRIDDVRVYNRALSGTEIASLAAGKCPQVGTTWATAFNHLQCALAVAASGDEIWVAQGIYKPSLDGDPSISFTLKDGVGLYGGFNGSEALRTQRNAAANLTTLSGDLNGDDAANFTNRSDNTARVLVGSGAGATSVLDGFTVRGGYARSTVPPSGDDGGGLYIQSNRPTLSNLVFTDNQATGWGGGIYIAGLPSDQISLSNIQFIRNKAQTGGGLYLGESPRYQISDVSFLENQAVYGGAVVIYHNTSFSGFFTRASFLGNSATVQGGALSLTGGTPTFVSSVFSGNHSVNGGAIYAFDSGYRLFNVTVSGNHASTAGGAFYNVTSNPIVSDPHPFFANTIFWGNTGPTQYDGSQSVSTFYRSLAQGGCPSAPAGTYCLSTIFTVDPLFILPPSDGGDGWGMGGNDVYGDLRFQAFSPAIDVGDSNVDIDWINAGTQLVPSPDLAGNVRFLDSVTSNATGLGTPPFIDLGAYEALFIPLYLPLLRR